MLTMRLLFLLRTAEGAIHVRYISHVPFFSSHSHHTSLSRLLIFHFFFHSLSHRQPIRSTIRLASSPPRPVIPACTQSARDGWSRYAKCICTSQLSSQTDPLTPANHLTEEPCLSHASRYPCRPAFQPQLRLFFRAVSLSLSLCLSPLSSPLSLFSFVLRSSSLYPFCLLSAAATVPSSTKRYIYCHFCMPCPLLVGCPRGHSSPCFVLSPLQEYSTSQCSAILSVDLCILATPFNRSLAVYARSIQSSNHGRHQRQGMTKRH